MHGPSRLLTDLGAVHDPSAARALRKLVVHQLPLAALEVPTPTDRLPLRVSFEAVPHAHDGPLAQLWMDVRGEGEGLNETKDVGFKLGVELDAERVVFCEKGENLETGDDVLKDGEKVQKDLGGVLPCS